MTTKYLKVKFCRDSTQFLGVSFLFDSGAVYSIVPGGELLMLGIEPYKKELFAMADGTTISRNVGEAYFEMDDGAGAMAPVIFGENHDVPLLGAATLSALGLVLNPFTRTLQPIKMTADKIKYN